MNKGYLNSSRTKGGDEVITPRCAVEPIVKYLKVKGFQHIWCPFDHPHSFFVRVLVKEGFSVVHSHKDDPKCVGNGDFLDPKTFEAVSKTIYECAGGSIDCIVSNPPFSKKDAVLKRLYEIGLPFMILLPQNSLQSIYRTPMFIKNGLEYLGFDKRIPFYTRSEVRMEGYTFDAGGLNLVDKNGKPFHMRLETDEEMLAAPKTGNHFASGYFCKDILPEKMVLEQLKIIIEPYFNEVK